ncbi:uncharacterized protein LOC144665488 [Oculina patagonica]
MSTPFKPEPFAIKDKERSMISAQNAAHTVTRNASFFKKLPSNIPVYPVPNDVEEKSTSNIEAAEVVELVEPPALHRPARARLVPERFKDYVTWTLLRSMA